ncbi:major facilitator family transmembrane transporter Mug111 [Schizosaccharomyces pombe]|uniref:Meiotically up-regulated gene 111 protein n=1 Tax=Schizosaccharomyces pombe (strain 972 / ATCC 24843) TaxID=284812 RepID=MU111_SCHPO|nr:protein mug111 [Schizosaccharomyces pombe]O74872.1 RecName: Full=Meiotically up-regulated gene 111 protein [Schizosaccharomyces pombe 972h-]CAA21223.1 sequence orphan [Schizosaccharomyces pombe]|eukprot:NP_587899.1 protein mug111 [Schizosaccharomyces pombe]
MLSKKMKICRPSLVLIYLWYLVDCTSFSMNSVTCLRLMQLLLAKYYQIPIDLVGEKLSIVSASSCLLQYLVALVVVPFYSTIIKKLTPWFTVFTTWVGEEYFFFASTLSILYMDDFPTCAYFVIFSISFLLGISGTGPSLNASYKSLCKLYSYENSFIVVLNSIFVVSSCIGPFLGSILLLRVSLLQLYLISWTIHFINFVFHSLLAVFFSSKYTSYAQKEGQPILNATENLEVEYNALNTTPSSFEEQPLLNGLNDSPRNPVSRTNAEGFKALNASFDGSYKFPIPIVLLCFFLYSLLTPFFDIHLQFQLIVMHMSIVQVGFINSVKTFGSLLTCSVCLFLTYVGGFSVHMMKTTMLIGLTATTLIIFILYFATAQTLPCLALFYGITSSIGPSIHGLVAAYVPNDKPHRYWKFTALLEASATFISYPFQSLAFIVCLKYCSFYFFIGPICICLLGSISSYLLLGYH